jgi:hypothetical protein
MLITKPWIFTGGALVLAVLIAGPASAQEKKAEKAKAEKISGDIGLLDTEKNYMIVVTKQGKLVTIDYNSKTKVTAMVPSKAKVSDIGLGSAASVQYTEKGGKNYLVAVEYVAKKGGD